MQVSERAEQCPKCGEPDPNNGFMDKKLRGQTRKMTVSRCRDDGSFHQLLGRIEPEGLYGEVILYGLANSADKYRYTKGSTVKVKIKSVYSRGQYAKVEVV